MRIVSWNPLSLLSTWRLFEVSKELAKVDVNIFEGTQWREIESVRTQIMTTEDHLCYHWGSPKGRAKFSNQAAGIIILLNRRRYRAANVRSIWSPPPDLRGRCGGLRVVSARAGVGGRDACSHARVVRSGRASAHPAGAMRRQRLRSAPCEARSSAFWVCFY